jgi:hypothetical protein
MTCDMKTFNFIAGIPPDLLSIVIEGQRIQLVAIADRFERDIFREFTDEITRYMYPDSARDIEETRNFIFTSRQSIPVSDLMSQPSRPKSLLPSIERYLSLKISVKIE